ncbi:MAG: hypothetical protein WCD70_02375, partial [Alphaproteobacteria bacterium]
SNIECGVVSMRLETVVIVAKSLGVTLSELFDFAPTDFSKGRTHRNAIETLVRLVQPLELGTIRSITKMAETAATPQGKKKGK